MPLPDPFSVLFWALVCAFLGWGLPHLQTTFRRILYGLTLGIIAATAFPYVESYFL
ncbi:MAG: hypothetical protein ACE5DK_01200 [Paracoccaceae bacterium]